MSTQAQVRAQAGHRCSQVRPAAPAGVPFHLRRAARTDRQALIEMLSRCSDQTRLRRFHGNLRSFPEPYFTEALAGSAEHFALVAETPGAVAALASCIASAGGAGELAIIVEDARQRQGIGGRLLRMLVEHAGRSGLRTLKATVLADQQWIVRALRSYGTCRAVISAGVFEVTVRREPGAVSWLPATSAHTAPAGPHESS